jgi:hypothetical protein
MSSHEPFLKADSNNGSSGDSKIILSTSLSAFHSVELKKLQQMSTNIFI